MAFVKFFYQLEVYKLSRVLAREVFEITKRFPPEERYSLTDQIRRSSQSIGGQIAESWAKRRYINHFISKLTDSDAEQYETRHWIDVAFDCGLVTTDKWISITSKCDEINTKLNAMIGKAELFCFKS